MNKIIILGRLTKSVEIKNINETTIANFSIALSRIKKDDGSDFFECKAFGKTAENIEKFFKKGSRILLQGSLRQESWTDNGKNRSRVVIIVDGFDFIDKKSDSETDTNTETNTNTNKVDDDVPF